jgi:putrescine aminotransferase
VQIVARLRAYHGLTYGATSATGLSMFWEGVGPLAPGFLHAPAPHPYRYEGDGPPGEGYAKALERVILEAGPETVAAVVAEPVQGAGGVIVPPADYLPRVREVWCQPLRVTGAAVGSGSGSSWAHHWRQSDPFNLGPLSV